jgi:apolipoprotein D and lipocalin family protein
MTSPQDTFRSTGWLRGWVLMIACLLGPAWTMAHAQAVGSTPPLAPIASLDVPRYLGTWYEVAKFPNRFQSMCAANTQAEYRLLASGQIEVINRCQKANGEITEAVGRARQIGDPQSPRLKVRFAPAWLSFLPMVWGNYWVIDLDASYQLAAVSEPSREYLWVLSRTPQVEPAVYEALIQRLQGMGFDTEQLVPSPQR